uniref:Uncharacterized protein n=1 Tax=viral metagenome TaxID=1070528 RepID=A0A6M3IV40_9ZZZZ
MDEKTLAPLEKRILTGDVRGNDSLYFLIGILSVLGRVELLLKDINSNLVSSLLSKKEETLGGRNRNR